MLAKVGVFNIIFYKLVEFSIKFHAIYVNIKKKLPKLSLSRSLFLKLHIGESTVILFLSQYSLLSQYSFLSHYSNEFLYLLLIGNMAQWLYPLTGYRWMPVRCELEITLKALVVSESRNTY